MVKEIGHFVGLSCKCFEEELLALFAAIELSRSKQVSDSCSSLGRKGNRELRRLFRSINYDPNRGNASHDRVRGRAACLNATFIALILKKSGAIDLKDFQPISLVRVVHNIIAKVHANRSRRVMEKLF
jgi:hypothetical protein